VKALVHPRKASEHDLAWTCECLIDGRTKQHPFSSLFKGDQNALKSCLCLTKIVKTDNNTTHVYVENGQLKLWLTISHSTPASPPMVRTVTFVARAGRRSDPIPWSHLRTQVGQRYCKTIFLEYADDEAHRANRVLWTISRRVILIMLT
jgi:hypothetical protein